MKLSHEEEIKFANQILAIVEDHRSDEKTLHHLWQLTEIVGDPDNEDPTDLLYNLIGYVYESMRIASGNENSCDGRDKYLTLVKTILDQQ